MSYLLRSKLNLPTGLGSGNTLFTGDQRNFLEDFMRDKYDDSEKEYSDQNELGEENDNDHNMPEDFDDVGKKGNRMSSKKPTKRRPAAKRKNGSKVSAKRKGRGTSRGPSTSAKRGARAKSSARSRSRRR